MARRSLVSRLSAICLALPHTKMTMTWGSPHFRVGEKIFCGCSNDADDATLGVKLPKARAKELVKNDARFTPAKYVGQHGWVDFHAGDLVDSSDDEDWDEVRELVLTSYKLIAPKRAVAKLTAAPPSAPRRRSGAAPRRAKR